MPVCLPLRKKAGHAGRLGNLRSNWCIPTNFMNPRSASPSLPYQFPQQFTPERREELFQEILQCYDLTEEILAAIQRPENPYREEELELFTPFITQSVNSFNIVSALYTEIVRKQQPYTPEIRETLEHALKNYYVAQKEMIDRLYSRYMPAEVAG